jgi:hypothetical protein
MNILKSLALAAVLTAGAATANASVIYANAVDSYVQGGNTVAGGIAPSRSNPANALGAPDGKFVALGLGGELIVSFAQPFKSPGALWEVTFGNRNNHLEIVDVFVGLNNIFTFVGSVTNAVGMNGFSFAGYFNQIKLVDTSPMDDNRDGFDVDAISVVPVPVPAAGLLLLSAIGAVSLLRRRTA